MKLNLAWGFCSQPSWSPACPSPTLLCSPRPSFFTPYVCFPCSKFLFTFFFLEHEELLGSNPELFPATASFLAGTEALKGNRNTRRWPPSPTETRAPAAGATVGAGRQASFLPQRTPVFVQVGPTGICFEREIIKQRFMV